jgi:hypothetical protein
MKEFINTPLSELTVIKIPKAPVLIPNSSVEYNDKYGIVMEIPVPTKNIQIMKRL